MQILVTDRLGIESGLLVRSAYIVISIHDPQKPPAKVPRPSALRALLVLAFHDAEPSSFATLPPHIQLMTPQHADAIRDFIRLHQHVIGAIVVHCEGGVSRSPAVAAALSETLGLDPKKFWQEYTPNHHVYHSVLDAFERRQEAKGEA